MLFRSEEALLDGEFMLNEFVDRFGPRLAHLNGVLQVLSQLSAMQNTANAMNANPNLSPTMLGGQQNAGVMTDRLGNRIYSPGAGPLFGYAKGGLAEMNAANLDDEEAAIDTNPAGTAQQYLSDLSNLSPNQLSTKRTMRQTPLPRGSGSARPKSSGMADLDALLKGDLGAMQDLTPKAKDTDSAKAQMQELARQ